MRVSALIATLLLASGTAPLAQHNQAGQSHTMSPYAGLETRSVKSLSDKQIEDLRAGRGMGFALSAELNGYPGPLHVLELANELRLSDAQRAKTQELYHAVKGETVPLGEKLIEQEAELDKAFAAGAATPEIIADLTRRIGVTQAGIRAAHLGFHLSTKDLLSAWQLQRYAELRGYGSRAHSEHR
jgi:hypothetical protein